MTTGIESPQAYRARKAYEALPHKHRAFVDLYVINFKVKESALAVGVPEISAASTGSRWLSEPHIALAVCHVMEEKAKLARIDAAWVLRRAALLADFNIKRFIHVDPVDGRPYYDFSQATEDDWYCIDTITVDALRGVIGEEGKIAVDRVKLKAYDKLKALELVAKHRDVQAFEKKAEGGEKNVVTGITRKIIRPGEAQLPPPVQVHD